MGLKRRKASLNGVNMNWHVIDLAALSWTMFVADASLVHLPAACSAHVM